jgi:hypothetical protein
LANTSSVGFQATVSASNRVVIGNSSVTDVYFGSESAAAQLLAAGLLITNGAAIKTDTTTAHTALLQAYDVDGTAYKTFGTLTNGNTPDFSIIPPAGTTVTLQATTFKSSDGTSGATAGPFTVITAIQVKNGLVTTLTGS